MSRLIRSSKFLVALLAAISTTVGYYWHVPTEILAVWNGLALAVIAGIAIEDAASKLLKK